MKIQEAINKAGLDVEVVQNRNYPSMVHIKYQGVDICAAPNEIFEDINPGHTNEFGDVHPSLPVVLNKIKIFIDKWNSDPEFKSLMTDPL